LAAIPIGTQGGEDVPVIYLPGIGRSAFRSADQCPNQAKHLFALQFQGQFWTQKNGKSWTPFAFFSSADGGLGFDVAGDQDTKKAIQESLPKLLKAELDALQGRKLEAGDFRAIITKDPAQTLLRWMWRGSGVSPSEAVQRLILEKEGYVFLDMSMYITIIADVPFETDRLNPANPLYSFHFSPGLQFLLSGYNHSFAGQHFGHLYLRCL
jgi:hypothetical protein